LPVSKDRCAKVSPTARLTVSRRAEQLDQILEEIDGLQLEQQASLAILQQNLAAENIYIVRPSVLVEGDMAWLEDEFLQSIFPVLTPLSIDPAHPFPFIPNLGFSICLQLASKAANEPMTALIRLPVALDRFLRLPDLDGAIRYITLEDVVSLFIGSLYPGYEVRGEGHVPDHPRFRHRGRGRGRGSGAAVRKRAQAPPPRFR
jgi:polyphosphate kinase